MKKSNLNKDERIYLELEHKKHIIEEQLIKKRIDLIVLENEIKDIEKQMNNLKIDYRYIMFHEKNDCFT